MNLLIILFSAFSLSAFAQYRVKNMTINLDDFSREEIIRLPSGKAQSAKYKVSTNGKCKIYAWKDTEAHSTVLVLKENDEIETAFEHKIDGNDLLLKHYYEGCLPVRKSKSLLADCGNILRGRTKRELVLGHKNRIQLLQIKDTGLTATHVPIPTGYRHDHLKCKFKT